jgi:hypothetical protein
VSVDYKLVCHEHEESVDICTDGFGGPKLFCDKTLAYFCITHRNCSLMVAEEQSYAYDEYAEWTLENCEELLKYV